MEPEASLQCSQEPASGSCAEPDALQIQRPLVTLRSNLFLWWGAVRTYPNSQGGGQSLVGCPRLLIQCIRSYPPYLEAVPSISNPRTPHAVVTGTHITRNLMRAPLDLPVSSGDYSRLE